MTGGITLVDPSGPRATEDDRADYSCRHVQGDLRDVPLERPGTVQHGGRVLRPVGSGGRPGRADPRSAGRYRSALHVPGPAAGVEAGREPPDRPGPVTRRSSAGAARPAARDG